MKLVTQPGGGVVPIVKAIDGARKSIDVLIFRLDRMEIADALSAAVKRGVTVRALIAHTNSGGEKSLRKLEMRLLEAGVTVARTADDLVRYHGKMMIVDARLLHVYGFNFTALDIKRSRSFGVITRHRRFVAEAVKLFEADCARQTFHSSCDRFIVSPDNARERLTAFIAAARHELLIYDPKISDSAILRALADRVRAGVDVRIIGKVAGAKAALTSEKYPGKRLHVRAMVRDGNRVFLGSQSLRRLELDKRREVGLIVDDPSVVRGIHQTFEQDWAETPSGRKAVEQEKDEARAEDAPAEAAAAG